MCAGSGDRGRSLYCQAGGEARCGADATVPLHLRAWERDDGRLTIDGGDGERKASRSETTVAWFAWTAVKTGGSSCGGVTGGSRARDAREGPSFRRLRF